jgi:hypothetical protein
MRHEEDTVTTLGYGGRAPSDMTDEGLLQRHKALADRLANRCWHATPLPVLEAVASALDSAMDDLDQGVVDPTLGAER